MLFNFSFFVYKKDMDFDIERVQRLVGHITPEQMKDVDAFIGDRIALFIPSTGPCKYAITPDHDHPGYSFVLAFDNFCRVVVEGKVYQSAPGTLAAFSPKIVHHEVITENFSRYVAIMIDKDLFEEHLKDYGLDKIPLFKGEPYGATNDLRNYIRDFMIESQNKLPGYKKVLSAIGVSLIHSIIRIIWDTKAEKQEISNRLEINTIIEYMHQNYSKKLTLEELSEQVCLSSSHFSRLFKKETGKSPLDYLIYLRLAKAKKLLLNSDQSLTEIALNTGFSSSSHFTSSFTKHFKITPSKFKKAI